MEFPFGHRRDDEEEQQRFPPPGYHHHHPHNPQDQPPPPSSYYGGSGAAEDHRGSGYGEYRPHPPASGYYGGGAGEEYGVTRPRPPASGYGDQSGIDYRPHPPASGYYGGGAGGEYGGRPAFQLVSNEGGYDQPRPYSEHSHGPGHYGGSGAEHNYDRPPSYSSGSHHGGGYEGRVEDPSWARKPTVRVFTRADENYSLTIRDGKVILARNDPSDEYQHWIKDLRFSTRVKDQEGFPSFALVNKVTGEAVKHSIGATHPVQLVPYKPDSFDESVLWTESGETGNGFRCIRMVNNIGLNFDAFNGDKDHGGVRDGTVVVLWEWLKGDNQQWKIVPQCKCLDVVFLRLLDVARAHAGCKFFPIFPSKTIIIILTVMFTSSSGAN